MALSVCKECKSPYFFAVMEFECVKFKCANCGMEWELEELVPAENKGDDNGFNLS